MVWVFLAIAALTAGLAVYLQNIWIGGVCMLAIAGAVWDGRSKGMWLSYEWDDLDGGGSSSSGSDGGGDGGGGGD